MTLIDRYLLRQFLWVFVIFFTSFLGLFIVADSVNNFEELSTYGKQHGGLIKVVAEYYGYRAFAFFDQISPLLILVAAMFTIAAFRRHNEMTALLAAGISKGRLARPIIVIAIIFALLATANREVMLPAVRDQLGFKPQDLVRETRPLSPTLDARTDILLSGKGVIKRSRLILRPNFILPRQLEQFGRQLSGRDAIYLPRDKQHEGGYLLRGLTKPTDLAKKRSLSIGDTPVIITPRDADWLEPDQCFVVSGVDFEQLSGGDAWRKFSSTPELIAGLDNPSVQQSADVRVKIHARVVKPILDVTLLFLGLPLVLSRQTKNLFMSVGFCVLVVFLFMVVVLGCHYLGSNATLSPAMAAWCPLMIFIPMAVGMSEPLRE